MSTHLVEHVYRRVRAREQRRDRVEKSAKDGRNIGAVPTYSTKHVCCRWQSARPKI